MKKTISVTIPQQILVNDAAIGFLVEACANNFRSFGGGQVSPNNPISFALADKPPTFAAGVDIREVVEFIVSKLN